MLKLKDKYINIVIFKIKITKKRPRTLLTNDFIT